MELRGPTRGSSPDPGRSFTVGQQEDPHQEPGEVVEVALAGQIAGFRISDQAVVDEREPVPEGLELLPEADLLSCIELFQSARFNGVEQTVECVVE
jgi:hypothetical protein